MSTELAWAAGFFDGEGCSYIMRYRLKSGENRGYPSITISQKDRRPLDRWVAAIGVGRVRGENSRLHNFHVCGTKAVAVMERMWPFLSEPKREQWERVNAQIADERRSHEFSERAS